MMYERALEGMGEVLALDVCALRTVNRVDRLGLSMVSKGGEDG